MTKLLLAATALTAFTTTFAGFDAQVEAAEPSNDIVVQEISTQCTTKATGGDGRRHGCKSDWVKLTAPAGYVINREQSRARLTSGNGSNKHCNQKFSGEAEVLPGTGLTSPTVTEIQAESFGPKGHFSGRGWAHCAAAVAFTKIK